MKRFRLFINALLLVFMITLAGFGDVFAGLLTPQQLVRYNRLGGRETDYRITNKEYSAYRKLYKTELTAPQGYQLDPEEMELVNAIEKKFYTLSPKELIVYKKLSEDKCLNILLVRPGAVVYNGEYLTSSLRADFPMIPYAHIAGDRLAYVNENNHAIVDDENYGPVDPSTPWSFELTKDHFAFISPVPVSLDQRTQSIEDHLIFDGKDMGLIDSFLGIKGDHILYTKYLKGERGWKLPHAFLDGDDIGTTTGYGFDIEGENRLMTEDRDGDVSTNDKNITYNGAVIRRLGSADTILNLTLKDGHRVYSAGPGPGNNYHHVYYDGKDLGFGTAAPLIEKNHLAYSKWPRDPNAHQDAFPRFVYDGKEYGPITTGPASLAGDHFAYLQLIFPKKPIPASDPYPGDWLAKVNIDGKLYPGIFPGISSDSYVEIAEKSECTAR